MDPQTVWKWLEQLLGAILIALALIDVFMTVLYARTHVGIIGDRVARITWRIFEWVAEQMGSRRGQILSYLGPAVVLPVGGHSITVVGDNNFSPATTGAQLFFIFASIASLIVTTLTLAYILHLYTALQGRGALGLEVHLLNN